MASKPSRTSRLQFHQSHGSNIVLHNKRKVAYRNDGYNNGITFTSRPILILEPIVFRINEIAAQWSGALRVGFTVHDPKKIAKIPAHSCPDLVSHPGNWAKALPENVIKQDCLISYYVDANGDVFYSINDDTERHLLSGVAVSPSEKLWGIVDVYGNTVAIELIWDSLSDSEDEPTSLAFHSVHGRNVTLKEDKMVASRHHQFCQYAYLFSNYPMRFDEKIVIRVLETTCLISGPLEYGVTSCNPGTLNSSMLPSDTEELLDSPDYWVYKVDSGTYNKNDLIVFSIAAEGTFTVVKNDTCRSSFIYVDVTQPLWLFLKLVGSIESVGIIGSSTSDYVALTRKFKKLSISAVSPPSEVPVDYAPPVDDAPLDPSEPSSSKKEDCVICCEKKTNCALYKCGHMCLCFECAKNLCSKLNATCPICRSKILDVIKIYT